MSHPAIIETKDTPLVSRQLVKDGVWQVPPEQRPPNWQSMSVRESVETSVEKKTRTKKTTKVVRETVVHVREPESAEVAPSVIVDVANTPREVSIPIPDFILRDNPALSQEVVDLHVLASTPDIGYGTADRAWERLCEIGDLLLRHRTCKADTDAVLGAWLDRNRARLRHVGLNSEPIRDLFVTIHRMLYDERSTAENKQDRAIRQATHEKKCDCVLCKEDRRKAKDEKSKPITIRLPDSDAIAEFDTIEEAIALLKIVMAQKASACAS